MFSDLSGYTAMNEKLDPEEVEVLMGRLKAEAVRIVESHGGIVSQFVGDEILALFGIPAAHEDDPSRAARAALDLHELARRLSPEVEGRIGGPLRLHTGIHSGLVVTSTRDVRDGTIGVTGDTVNTAARLKALAASDAILLSAETQHRLAPYFVLEVLPSTELKGKAGTVAPYRVIRESRLETRFDAAKRLGLTPFTGRERELETLTACLEKAVAGEGQLVAVVGEAGVGKSRMVHEFSLGLGPTRTAALRGQCSFGGANTPYLPLTGILRGCLGLADGDGTAGAEEQREKAVAAVRAISPELEKFIPQFLHLLSFQSGERPLRETLGAEELHRSIQLALAALLLCRTEQGPLAVILEDWHWSDDASKAVVNYLAGVMGTARLMLLVNYRPEIAPDWGTLSHFTALPLASMDVRATKSIVAHVFGVERLPDGLTAAIHERTGGNPFFVEETCRSLLEQGKVRVKETREAVLTGSLLSLGLPDTVQAVIRSRLDRLQAEVQEVVCVAAVIGQDFSEELVGRLCADRTALFPALEQLKALGLIQQLQVLPEPRYRFKHRITQEVAYGTLLLQRRKTLHLQVAENMEALYNELPLGIHEVLAGHFFQAEAWARAAPYFLFAAEQAKAHFLYQGALELCEAALDATSRGGGMEPERMHALALHGDLLGLVGRMDAANAAFQEAIGLARNPADAEPIRNKVHRPFVATRAGAKMTYFIHGSGKETLLFLQPIPYGLESFQALVEDLCQEFRIITLMPRGTKGSDPVPDGFSLDEMAEDTCAVIEAAGGGPVIGIGVSRGARTLVRLTVAHPQVLSKMVLVGCGIEDRKPVLRFPRRESPQFAALREAVLEKMDLEETVKRFVPVVLSEPGTEELVKLGTERVMSLSERTLRFFFEPHPSMEIGDLFAKISIPTLVAHGEEDLIESVDGARWIAEEIPDAIFYPFAGRGHNPQMTAISEFCDVLRQFVTTGNVNGAQRLERKG